MALSAANSDNLIIDYVDMQVAVTLVKQVAANLDRAFRGSGSNVLAEVTSKIQEFIEAKGITTRKEILKHNHFDISSEDLNRVLYLLEEIDFVTITIQGGQSIIKFNPNQKKGIVASKITDLIGGGSGTGI